MCAGHWARSLNQSQGNRILSGLRYKYFKLFSPPKFWFQALNSGSTAMHSGKRQHEASRYREQFKVTFSWQLFVHIGLKILRLPATLNHLKWTNIVFPWPPNRYLKWGSHLPRTHHWEMSTLKLLDLHSKGAVFAWEEQKEMKSF